MYQNQTSLQTLNLFNSGMDIYSHFLTIYLRLKIGMEGSFLGTVKRFWKYCIVVGTMKDFVKMFCLPHFTMVVR